MVKSLFFRVAILCVASAVSGIAWGQTSSGTLVGLVTDQTGAVVPKATVTALSSEFGATRETHTDAAGTYRLEGLQPGTYIVTISVPGFKTISVRGVTVNASLTTTINGKLELAPATQMVEVEATAAQVIDTQSGQMAENLSHQEVTQLPYSSLNPAELALTLPGVHYVPGSNDNGAVPAYLTNGFSFSVNGSRPRANNFLIDGQDDNDYTITGQALQPVNYGAIQETTILTNAYSAEYGRGGGSVTNYIYKSGTNKFHGDLWEINQNSAVAAIPPQAQISQHITKNPYFNDNTFGFDVGGPVIKDKLFAFGTAQWDHTRQRVTGPVFKLPTAAGIATLKSLLPNANISLFLTAIGSLESPGQSGVATIDPGNGRPLVQIGDVQFKDVPTAGNSYDWNYRMDWHFTGKDTLTGSILRDNTSLSPDNFANPAALPNFQTEQHGPSQFYRAQWARTISPSLLNELRFSYTSIFIRFLPTAATAAGPLANIPFIVFGQGCSPNCNSDTDFPSIGVDSGFPQGRGHHTYQVQEALSYAAGRHTFKFGADITVLRLNDFLPLDTRGTITYAQSKTPAFSSLGNFIDDWTGADPGTISKSFGNPNLNSNATMYAPYVQDAWRVRSNLTLDLGLRYEYWGALANALAFPAFNVDQGFGVPNITDPAKYADAFSFKQIPDKRNFAPRVGFAYTPHWGKFFTGEGKTTIRAGYGIFYDGLFTNITGNTYSSEPNTLGGSLALQSGRGTKNASTTGIGGITPQPNSHLTIDSMASNLHNPMTQQWNVNVQRELPLGLVLTLAYVGTKGTHLFANQDFNPQVLYSFTNPVLGEIAVRTNAGDSRYNSGQVEVERKIHTLVLRAAYTYSKFMDDSSEIFTTTGTSSYAQVLTNQRSDWGPSAFDQRHRLAISYVWEVPYFHRNAFLRALTDQWQWSSIAAIESGTPNTVEAGFDNIGNGHPNSRPDLGNPAAPLNSFAYDGGDVGGPYASGQDYEFNCVNAWLASGGQNPTCPAEPGSMFHFIVPNTRPGNVGRNSLFGPGQVFFDTTIERDFPIHVGKLESQTLSFRTDFFNAFNHPNLFTPSYTMTDPNFNNTAITVTGGRTIKFWLKYSF